MVARTLLESKPKPDVWTGAVLVGNVLRTELTAAVAAGFLGSMRVTVLGTPKPFAAPRPKLKSNVAGKVGLRRLFLGEFTLAEFCLWPIYAVFFCNIVCQCDSVA